VKAALRNFSVVLAVTLIVIVIVGYRNATRDPIVRTASVRVAKWPAGVAPIKVLLVSDIHVSGPDMPPERVIRVARRLNALKPDLVLIAGDLISAKRLATHHYSVAEAVAPLKTFKAPLGVIVALGNHDQWTNPVAFQRELINAKLTPLLNEAVKRGPLVIGGVDDAFSNHADLPQTYRAMARYQGVPIIVTHDPDVVADLPERVAAVFAGHTHCGQITKPWSGEPVANVSRFGMRFQCGDIRDGRQRLFVTAGLGTSVIWLRYGAPPDAWLVTLGP
jgi:uncharacterized protein